MSKNNIGGIGYQLDNLANPVTIAGLSLLPDGLHSGNDIDLDQHNIVDVKNMNVTNTTSALLLVTGSADVTNLRCFGSGQLGTATADVLNVSTINANTANSNVSTTINASVTGTATIATASVTGTATMTNASVTGTATMLNSTVTGTSIVPAPTSNSHAATKIYVDSNVTSLASSIAGVRDRAHSKWFMRSPQTILNSVDTKLIWNSVSFSSGDFTLNIGLGQDTFTCVNAGTYIISVTMSFTTSIYYAFASLNGGVGGTWFLQQGTTGVTNFTATFPFFFAVGNTVSIFTFQSSGISQTSPKNTLPFDQNTIFFAKISNAQ